MDEVRQLDELLQRVNTENTDANDIGKIQLDTLELIQSIIAQVWKNYTQNVQQDWELYRQQKITYAKDKGNLCMKTKLTDSAIFWFTVAILFSEAPDGIADYKNPISSELLSTLYSNRSAAYTNVARHKEALSDAEHSILYNPTWSKLQAKAYSRKAVACYYLMRYDESLQAYQKALELDPTNSTIQQGLQQVQTKVKALDANEKGEAALAKMKISEALEYFNQAIRLDPQEAFLYSNRSEVYLKAEKYKEALSDAQEILKIRPEWFKGYQRKGEALAKLGRYEEAASAFATALTLEPNNSTIQTEMHKAIQEDLKSRSTHGKEVNSEKKKWWQFW